MTKELLRRRLLLDEKTRPREGGSATTTHAEETIRTWIDPLDVRFDEAARTLFVRFPHVFFGLRFMNLFRRDFERAAEEALGEGLTVLYEDGNGAFERSARKEKAETTSEKPLETKLDDATDFAEVEKKALQQPVSSGSRRRAHAGSLPYGEEWTFETFIANGKHKWALGLAKDLVRKAAAHAENPAKAGDKPGILVLCGPHGTGKTHLLRAIGNELFRLFGDETLCASLSELELLFASAPAAVVQRELKEKRALLLDDFQYLSSVPEYVGRTERPDEKGVRFQEALCLLLDRFMDQGKPFVVAGVGRPKDWNLGRALLSRLETGLWTELPEPDLDVRLRYVQQQARLKRLPLPKEHVILLARHCSTIRSLSGAVKRIVSHRALVGRDLSEQDVLNVVRQGDDDAGLTAQRIVIIVGEHCGVSPKDILGEKRRPDMIQARQLSMYLCRELLGHSYPLIGRMFGGKDHSTVMHGVKKIKALQESDRLTHTLVTELTKACLECRD